VCTFARALHVLERECAGSLSVYLQRFEDAHVVASSSTSTSAQ
jgi:hypothetical protein